MYETARIIIPPLMLAAMRLDMVSFIKPQYKDAAKALKTLHIISRVKGRSEGIIVSIRKPSVMIIDIGI
jgi:hypothetical protein